MVIRKEPLIQMAIQKEPVLDGDPKGAINTSDDNQDDNLAKHP